jgi:hypothetical protein
VPRQSSRSRRTPTVSPAAALELAESGGSWFEEASDHAQAVVARSPLRLGPVVSLPAASLPPGVLGWQRSVRSGRRAAGVLYYLVGKVPDGKSGPSPVPEFDWNELAAAERCHRPTPGMVLAQGPSDRKKSLRDLAGRVSKELASLDD